LLERRRSAGKEAVERLLVEDRRNAEASLLDQEPLDRVAGLRRAGLRRLVLDLTSAGRRVAAYGAAGRATILLNCCGLGSDLIDYVVDASPLRYGRYVPGVGIPIVPPERFRESPPDYAIVTAWNYEAEIVAKEQAFLSEGGVFIVPLPDVRLVEAESCAAVSAS
jgi:hypothetical protein